MAFYQEFRYCSVPFTPWLGDGHCNSIAPYNTNACSADGGDCVKFNEMFPNGDCKVPNGTKIGDGICDNFGNYNTEGCNYDGGDCLKFNEELPGCKAIDLDKLGDGTCHADKEYNNKECLFDNSDCIELHQKYPNCIIDLPDDFPAWFPNPIGDNYCSSTSKTPWYTEECGWEGGDCDRIAGNYTSVADVLSQYPSCKISVGYLWALGNGLCNSFFNNEDCGWDDGDCIDFNNLYPDCKELFRPYWVGDGTCHRVDYTGAQYDSPECGFDGGDCVQFNIDYPNCTVDQPNWIGDGECDGGQYNQPECAFDGGDCVGEPPMAVDSLPECFVDIPYAIGDGNCDGGEYNTAECGYDNGDCSYFNSQFPGCEAEKPYEVGDGVCHVQYDTEECRYDGGDCERSVLFLYGKEVAIDEYKNDTRIFSIVQSSFSSVSLLSSIAILCVIYRSYEGLSTTINRLLFGLSVSDLLSSFAQAFATLPAPKEFADVIWNAKGSVASCEAQGFFILVGSLAAPLYNCSLCFYYLVVLKYNKKEDFIKKKVEPFLHAFPIGISLLAGFLVLGLDAFNPNMTYCFIGPDPTCDDIACDRITDSTALFVAFSALPYISLPSIIIVTMTTIYKAVLTHEKKLEKYGAGALRKNLKKKAAAAKAKENELDKRAKGKPVLDFLQRRPKGNKDNAVRKKNKRSRAILNTAFAYSLAFLLSYSLPLVISIQNLFEQPSGFVLSVLVRIFFPLQGMFNFCVFIYPKVTAVKRKHKDIGLLKAFWEALKSRGAKRKVSRSLKSSRKQNRGVISYLASKLKFLRMKASSSLPDQPRVVTSSQTQNSNNVVGTIAV